MNNFLKSAKDNAPLLLIIGGCVGIAATAVSVFKKTPEYYAHVESKKEEMGLDEDEELPKTEKIKIGVRTFWSSAALGAASGACFFGAHHIDVKRQITLGTALAITETTLHDTREKIKEKWGENKEKEVRDAIAEDKMRKNPPPEGVTVREGEQLFYCPLGNEWFSSTHEQIGLAVADICRRLQYEDFVSLNEFYDYLGVAHSRIGDSVGWTSDKPIEMSRTSSNDAVISPWGTAAIVVPYRVEPRWRPKYGDLDVCWD